MNVPAQPALDQRDESVAEKHVTQTEPKESPILVDAFGAEGRQVQRTGNEGIGKQSSASAAEYFLSRTSMIFKTIKGSFQRATYWREKRSAC